MNRLDKPHCIYYLRNMPKGTYQYPTKEKIDALVADAIYTANKYGSGKAIDRGADDLAPPEELFRRFYENAMNDYNGGLRIEQVDVSNKEDAKIKIKEIQNKEHFVKFMFPLSTYGLEEIK